jgi:ABC-type ATPase involved in cell division
MVTHEHNLVKHFGQRIIEIQSGTVVADTADHFTSAEEVLYER